MINSSRAISVIKLIINTKNKTIMFIINNKQTKHKSPLLGSNEINIPIINVHIQQWYR